MNDQISVAVVADPGPPTSDLSIEQLPARLWATMLGITPKAFQLRKITSCGQRLIRGGLTKVFQYADLPDDYREQLEEKRRKFRCLRFADLLDIQSSQRWEPEKKI